MKSVNKCIRKKDSMELLLGKPVYTDDLTPKDCLVVKLLRSPYANAIVKDINIAIAMKVPGIEAIYTYKDIDQHQKRFTCAGQTYPEPSPYDRLILDQHVRFIGDPVAIVAGETENCVDKAIKLIKAEYEVLEPVLDFTTALDNPILVHPEDNWEALCPVGADNKRNLCAHDESSNGDVDKVLDDCDIIIDRTYHTKACQQSMMETFRTYCTIDTYGRLNVISSTQIVFHCRRIISHALGISPSLIRVTKPRIGGGFGAKQTSVSEIYPAFVTWRTKKPSKIIFSRYESLTASSPRHEMQMHVRLGATKDGIVKAIDLHTLSNTGAYGEHGPTTVGLSGHKSIPLYGKAEAFRFTSDVVYTNIMSAGAYRGYGATQGIFALESAVNELAEKLKIDPVELRMKNIVREGMFMPAYFGETANACALDRCITHCADHFHWKEKYPVRDMGNGKVRTAGMAIAMQGSCISNVDVGSCTLKLSDDGTYNMLIGAADMGTGCDTILAQMAAEVLDCEPDQIVVFGADTDASPYDSGSYASSTTYVTGMATQNAAMELRENMMKIGAELLGCTLDEVEFDGEKVYLVDGDRSVSLADIAVKSQVNNRIPVDVTATYSSPVSPPPYMVGMAEIELDKETGSVKILDYDAVVDCGIPVNPNLARVQTEGGIGQGIGMALYENVTYNANGKITEGDFMQYKIPTRQDVGNIHVEFETSYEPSGPFGVKSIGEIVINTPAPALAHAIYRATGVWHRTVPFTPEKILMGMLDPDWKETDHRVKD